MIESIPKISIVTPSFNQGDFLEETILSVLSQKYPNLEYIIIDGGSTDNSIEIISKYKDQLAYWVSERDTGQYEAINKGFAKSTGEIMAWINSDDKYMPWCFQLVSEIFRELPEVEWLTTLFPFVWDENGRPMRCFLRGGYNQQGFLKGDNLPDQCIQQESVFWRRTLWEKTNETLNCSYNLAADFELWNRFFQKADLYSVQFPLGGFRLHSNQKSLLYRQQYIREANEILANINGYYPNNFEIFIRLIFKKYIMLPYSFRRLLIRLKLKKPNKICAYSQSEKKWYIDLV
jgi:glycosyltransferase involved in cell wall biosynthesis